MTVPRSRRLAPEDVETPNREPIDKRLVLGWEVAAFFIINLVAGALHFVFELSNFSTPVAVFGSVNESTFEHLKLYFWPALVVALVQHAYVRTKVNNYWWGKGLAMAVTPLTIVAAFYFYLGIALPIFGKGFLALDIGTGVLGVLAGNVVAYRVLTSEPKARRFSRAGWVLIGGLTVLMATAAWYPPQFFLYENFYGYQYTGEFGILSDYTDYLVFTGR